MARITPSKRIHNIPVANHRLTAAHVYKTTKEILVLFASKNGGGDIVALVHSHHLLDHKPDNMIAKGGKFKLRGVACLGRPGVALCAGPQAAIDKFVKKLKSAMPQKKFSTICLPDDCATEIPDGFEEATLGELRQLLATVGQENHFFTIAGMDPSNMASNDSSIGENATNQGGKKTRSKKRKR